MALVRYTSFVEIDDPQDAQDLLDEIATAICGAGHDLDDAEHECSRGFVSFAGVVDDDQVDWKQMAAESFAAILPKTEPGEE